MFCFKQLLAVTVSKISFGFFTRVDNSDILTERDLEVAITRERQKIKKEMLENTIAENGSLLSNAAYAIEDELTKDVVNKENIKIQTKKIIDILFPEPTIEEAKEGADIIVSKKIK